MLLSIDLCYSFAQGLAGDVVAAEVLPRVNTAQPRFLRPCRETGEVARHSCLRFGSHIKGELIAKVKAVSARLNVGWILSRGSDTIPFPQPKPRTVGIHLIMPSVCGRKVAQLEWSGVRKGENVLQPFNLCDRLLGVHSASIFTRSGAPKESVLLRPETAAPCRRETVVPCSSPSQRVPIKTALLS